MSLVDSSNRRPTKNVECTPTPAQFNDYRWHDVRVVKKNRLVTLSCDNSPVQTLQSDVEIPFINTKYGIRLGSHALDTREKGFFGELSQVIN